MRNVVLGMLLLFVTLSAQAQEKNNKNAKYSVEVNGNCDMCKKRIEKASLSVKGVKTANWNEDTHQLNVILNETKCTIAQVQKAVALAGYDNAEFLAPTDAYNNLPGCCQYERVGKTAVSETPKVETSTASAMETKDAIDSNKADQLKSVFDNYFAVKDALVKTDEATASASAKALVTSINSVQMEKLDMNVHMVWMKVVNNLKDEAQHIADAKETNSQRNTFIALSENIYQLIKVSKQDTPTYYQHCPMANDGKGANWLSKENNIKNPYFGSMMLSCGKTVETIK